MVGDSITLKLVGEESGGLYTILEEVTPPQGGPPLCVLEGTFEFWVAGRTIPAAGDSAKAGIPPR